MKHPSVQALQTRRLIADIRRVVDILNVDIAQEESATGISDPKLPEYSMVARALTARRVTWNAPSPHLNSALLLS
jgi:hypothetical protein